MIANIDAALDKAYKDELRMIEVNGGNESALKFRYECLRQDERKLLDYIERIQLEFLGRKKALSEQVRKLKNLGEL